MNQKQGLCAESHLLGNTALYSFKILCLALIFLTTLLSGYAQSSPIRVSTDSGGLESNGGLIVGGSIAPVLSTDGRYVAFHSDASNLVAGDTNAGPNTGSDVFIKDTLTGATTRASTDSSGLEGNGNSFDPVLSADGRYVAFWSLASNLVAGDNNRTFDVFIKDTQTGATTRVSTDSSGLEGTGTSSFPVLSSDGRYVAFHSFATDLVAGDNNGFEDVFIKDTLTNVTTRVSTDSGGLEGTGASPFLGANVRPTLSADARYVAFHSAATNLVAGDINGVSDVFIKDRQTGATTRVSTDSLGVEGNNNSSSPVLSADGRYVAFSSGATNLVTGDTSALSDVFLKDTLTGTTTRVSTDSLGTESNSNSSSPVLSADGRYVAFSSGATNLVTGDNNEASDIFVKDTQTGVTTRVSTDSSGLGGTGDSSFPAISTDGHYVAFASAASNLVAGDNNGVLDVFRAESPVFEFNLNGTIKTTAGVDICAMVLVSGQFMFSCNPRGIYSFTDLPLEANGTVKLQVYAQGFRPYIVRATESQTLDIVMTRAGDCPNYNATTTPGVFPDSAGNRIDISGSVEVGQNGDPVCAMVLANGQFMFSCGVSMGSYALNVPLDANGQVKLQVYAQGFAPYIVRFDETQTVNNAKLARASECSTP